MQIMVNNLYKELQQDIYIEKQLKKKSYAT